MSQIQKRMEALGVKQVDMILELRKRGIEYHSRGLYLSKGEASPR